MCVHLTTLIYPRKNFGAKVLSLAPKKSFSLAPAYFWTFTTELGTHDVEHGTTSTHGEEKATIGGHKIEKSDIGSQYLRNARRHSQNEILKTEPKPLR